MATRPSPASGRGWCPFGLTDSSFAQVFSLTGARLSLQPSVQVRYGSKPGVLRLTVGDYDTDNKDVYEVNADVSRIVVHRGYDPNNNDILASANNIALLKLTHDVTLQESCLQPVCLPRNGYFPNTYDRCFIAGWGETGGFRNGQLQAVSVRSVARTTCNDFIGSSSGSTISKDKLCSLPATDNADACLGDAGGMLVCPEVSKGQNRFVLMGLIDTFDTNCQGSVRNNNPTIYTNVVSHLDWILRNM
ncbi:plasminogen-like [Gigantopelta aegis]|uniref:plasminogen-like n=1 Tax=Gigantopelta aegis TaxID=1735272 RepID=UPI001B88903E|nr:plasminogen-like [Gigantopelta aegis]